MAITHAGAAPLYEEVCKDLGWSPDANQLASMKSANEKQLAELDEKLKDAEENLGDIEVRDAHRAKADYLAKIGDRAAAGKAYAVTEEKTAGANQKLDLVFSLLRYPSPSTFSTHYHTILQPPVLEYPLMLSKLSTEVLSTKESRAKIREDCRWSLQ